MQVYQVREVIELIVRVEFIVVLIIAQARALVALEQAISVHYIPMALVRKRDIIPALHTIIRTARRG